MLRAVVILLLLANLGFWAWHHEGVAQALGLPRHSDREPERVERQVNSDAVRLLSAAASAAGPGAAPCMQTEALDPAAAAAVARALRLAGLPTERWSELRRESGGTWAVVLGQGEPALRLRRRLADVNLEGTKPQIVDGAVQLATFASAEAAESQLQAWRAEQSLRGAQVVVRTAPTVTVRLRAEQLDAASWAALKAATPDGTAWAACE